VEKVQYVLLGFIPLLFSLSFHEAAHAWTANKLGDPTAKFLGRLTLSPIPHIDPIGTVFLPILFMFMGGSIFGWAKPVPVNYRNLRGKYGELLVAAAGPVSNLFLALVFTGLLFVFNKLDRPTVAYAKADVALLLPLVHMIVLGIHMNILLALFNLLPLPPLDGSRVAVGLFPQLSEQFRSLERYGFLILIALLYTGILTPLVFGPARRVSAILLQLAAG
jgi:Zn-dependent protease